MQLTREEQQILDGTKGATLQKIMQSVVNYGKMFDAIKLANIEHNGHFVMSMGSGVIKGFFTMLNEVIEAGLKVPLPFTVDPRPIDHKNVKSNLLQKLVFKIVYSKQEELESQYEKLGLKNSLAFSCACYLPEVGNVPQKGDILAWSESSAVVFVNSVFGARTNRNAGGIDMLMNILGKTPVFGLLTDEGRKAKWLVEVKCSHKPNAQLLGSAIGYKLMEDVPYIVGLDSFLGTKLTDENMAYLKDMGAAAASNGAIGLYHVGNLTPEAVEQGKELLIDSYKNYIIDDDELERVYNSYPNIWQKPEAEPKKCFIGCPHLSSQQLREWTNNIARAVGSDRVKLETILLTAPDVGEAFKQDETMYNKLRQTGAKMSYICPLMYMANPLCRNVPIVTNSNKLRTYTKARFFKDDEILEIIKTGKISKKKKIKQPKTFKGRAIIPGDVTGEALVSQAGLNPLASWKDACLKKRSSAKCSDQDNKELYEKRLDGKIICLPQVIGSTTGGLMIQTAAQMGLGPKALLFSNSIDSLAAAGVVLSDIWAGEEITTVDQLGDEFLKYVEEGMQVVIHKDGTVEVAK